MWPVRLGPKLRCNVPSFPNADFSASIRLLQEARDDTSTKAVHVKGLIKLPVIEKRKKSPRRRSPRRAEGKLSSPRSPKHVDNENGEYTFLLPEKLSPRKSGTELNDGGGPIWNSLQSYDDPTEFELHTPQEWIFICQSQVHPQACFRSGELTEFRPCWVRAYDPKTSLFAIELTNGHMKKVSRLSLRFNNEPPELFDRRIKECKTKRDNAELRYMFGQYISMAN